MDGFVFQNKDFEFYSFLLSRSRDGGWGRDESEGKYKRKDENRAERGKDPIV